MAAKPKYCHKDFLDTHIAEYIHLFFKLTPERLMSWRQFETTLRMRILMIDVALIMHLISIAVLQNRWRVKASEREKM
jgi:hypothetical protein